MRKTKEVLRLRFDLGPGQRAIAVPVRRKHGVTRSCWCRAASDIVTVRGVSYGLSQDLARAVRGHTEDS